MQEEVFVGAGGKKVVYLALLNPSIEEIEYVTEIKIGDGRMLKAYNSEREKEKLTFSIRYPSSPSIADKYNNPCKVKIYYTVKTKVK